MYDFFISTCADDTVTRETINCVQAIKNYKFYWISAHGGGPCRPKNVGMTQFLLEDDALYFISIDRDIIFTQKHIDYLVEDLRSSDGMTIFGGCYVIKDGSRLACSDKADNSEIQLDGRMEEVMWMSTGFLGVSRKLVQLIVDELKLPLLTKGVLAASAYPFFEDRAYEDPNLGWLWLSEDYEFSRKARSVGANVLLDTRIWLEHLGKMKWTVKEMLLRQLDRRAYEGNFNKQAKNNDG